QDDPVPTLGLARGAARGSHGRVRLTTLAAPGDGRLAFGPARADEQPRSVVQRATVPAIDGRIHRCRGARSNLAAPARGDHAQSAPTDSPCAGRSTFAGRDSAVCRSRADDRPADRSSVLSPLYRSPAVPRGLRGRGGRPGPGCCLRAGSELVAGVAERTFSES